MAKRVLLTGGCGYIGSHVAVELQRQGYDVILYDNLSNSRAEVADIISHLGGRTAEFVEGDILDEAKILDTINGYTVHYVMHFAGLKSVSESVRKPDLYRKVNYDGSIKLLSALEEVGYRPLVFSSSASVYGNSNIPISEGSPALPSNPYAQTKLDVDLAMRDGAIKDDRIRFHSLRYFNPVGAHSSGLLGENPKNLPNNLVPIMMNAVSSGEPMKIFGTDYETPDGTCIRDYIHIDDLVWGHILALENSLKRRGYHVFNLGTGTGVSVLEMISAFESVTGEKVPYVEAGRRMGDVAKLTSDSGWAEQTLKWKAKGTLESMLASAWNYHCNKINNKAV